MPESFRLSHPAIEVLCEELGLDPSPFPFEIPRHGQGEPARDDVRTELEQRGLADEGRTDDALDEAMVLFAHPEIVVTAFGKLDRDERLLARICSNGRRTIRAIGLDNEVLVEELPVRELISGAVDLLPDIPAGAGQAVTFPVQPNQDGPRRTSRSRTAVRERAAETMLAQEKLRFGQFRITVRHPDDEQDHGPDLFWFDTPAGRYVTYRSIQDGQTVATYAPADSSDIAELLESHANHLIG
jgi:hypothetical protein